MKLIEAKDKEITSLFPNHNVRIERNAYNVQRMEFNSPSGTLILWSEYGFKAHSVAPPEMVDKWTLKVERKDGFSKEEQFDDEAKAQSCLKIAQEDEETKTATLTKSTVPKEEN